MRANSSPAWRLDAEARPPACWWSAGPARCRACRAAVVDAYAPQFQSLQTVSTVISPGNSFDPGLATTQSILGSLGRRIDTSAAGKPVRGWQGLAAAACCPAWARAGSAHCDAPDRDLFPQRYAGLKSCRCLRGAGGRRVSFGTVGALGSRAQWTGAQSRKTCGARCVAIKRTFGFLGSDRGGMAVTLEGAGPRRRAEAY